MELAPAVFATDEEYVSFVKLAGADAPADCETRAAAVSQEQEENVRRAARECPAKCIKIA
jgi:ferredoxin